MFKTHSEPCFTASRHTNLWLFRVILTILFSILKGSFLTYFLFFKAIICNIVRCGHIIASKLTASGKFFSFWCSSLVNWREKMAPLELLWVFTCTWAFFSIKWWIFPPVWGGRTPRSRKWMKTPKQKPRSWHSYIKCKCWQEGGVIDKLEFLERFLDGSFPLWLWGCSGNTM